MPVNDELGKRMKEFYEGIPKTKLMRRCPVAIRLDIRAAHTFARGFVRPFDEVFGNAMARTMEYLCKNIQGCIFGYKQSDEITLVLSDYRKLTSDAWFDYEVQKMCSISASMTTMAFNKFFRYEVDCFEERNVRDYSDSGVPIWKNDEAEAQHAIYWNAIDEGAMFDSRCFNIPKEEVVNMVYWRQLDATRNSIQMVGQANFSHSELQKKSCNDIQDMLFTQKSIHWNDFPTKWKRGMCWTKERGIDWDMPMLKGEDREYLEQLVYYQEEK